MSGSQSSNLDAIYALLADSRRRYLLYHFLETEYGNLEKLSRRIAAWEAETAPRSVSEDERRDVAVSLVHDHLPRLADHGAVDYDARSGDIVTASAFEDFRPFVEQARTVERTGEIPDSSHLSVLYSKPPEEEYLDEA